MYVNSDFRICSRRTPQYWFITYDRKNVRETRQDKETNLLLKEFFTKDT